MKEFYGNPIKVMKKNQVVDFIDLDIDFNESTYYLKISYLDEVLFNTEVNRNTFLSINTDMYPEIYMEYISTKTKETLFSREVVLDKTKKSSIDNKKTRSEKEIIKEIYSRVKDRMDKPIGTNNEIEKHTEMLNNATVDIRARKYIENEISKITSIYSDKINQNKLKNINYEIYSNLYGMGVIQELDDRNTIGEILVNAKIHPYFSCDIYYYEGGEKKKFDKTFKNLNEIDSVFSRSIKFAGKELNQVENAIVEATRSNGDRVTISIPSASPNNYSLNIRKFTNFTPTSEGMKKSGTINPSIEQLLKILVEGKTNIGIGGEMGSGKTTMINYLLTHTKKEERKVVIASVNEIDVDRVLEGHDIIFYGVDENKNFSFEKLIKTSLRTTASRVIIPESRGDEFKQVYEANLKTRGNMFTAHALNDESFLEICSDMYNADTDINNSNNIQYKIAKSIDIIIIMKKIGSSVRVQSISEVIIDNQLTSYEVNPLIYWVADPENPTDCSKGYYEKTGNTISKALKNRLNSNGIPMSVLNKY